jgi:hypothetical protein
MVGAQISNRGRTIACIRMAGLDIPMSIAVLFILSGAQPGRFAQLLSEFCGCCTPALNVRFRARVRMDARVRDAADAIGAPSLQAIALK